MLVWSIGGKKFGVSIFEPTQTDMKVIFFFNKKKKKKKKHTKQRHFEPNIYSSLSTYSNRTVVTLSLSLYL